MASSDAAAFAAQLRRLELLSANRLDEIDKSLVPAATDSRSLAAELVRRTWLTAFQANSILQGAGDDLVVGTYQILDRVGSGGMGQVYRARHTRMGRQVALKIISKDKLSNAVAVERFYREAQAASQLNHPNIVAAFDVGNVGGQHYFAMELVEGADLSKMLKERGPLPIAEACEYARQAALGLQAAAEKGVVHRDIKPSNLLVAAGVPHSSNSVSLVKILDFGLARFESEAGVRSNLTQVGRIVGTVDYMSPEQAEDARKCDIRSDIYSLGCTLYYMLTGQPPFTGPDMVAKIMARLTLEPRPIRGFRPEVSTPLEQLILKMLARDPLLRFQTPDEVARALEPVIALHSGQAPRPASGDKGKAGTAEEPLSIPGEIVSPVSTGMEDDPFAASERAPPLRMYGTGRRRGSQDPAAAATGSRKLMLFGGAGVALAAAAGIIIYFLTGGEKQPTPVGANNPTTTAPATDPAETAPPATSSPVKPPPRALPLKERVALSDVAEPVRAAVVDGSGDQVFVLHEKVIRAWSLADGKMKSEFKADPVDDGFAHLLMVANGKLIVSVTGKGTVRTHDPADLKETGKVDEKVSPLCAAVTPDQTTLALGVKGLVLLTNLDNFAVDKLPLENADAAAHAVVFTSDGDLLSVLLASGEWGQYDWRKKELYRKYIGPKEAMTPRALAPDGELVAYSNMAAKTIVVWDPVLRDAVWSLAEPTTTTGLMQFGLGKMKLLAVRGNTATRFYDFGKKAMIHEEASGLVSLSADGKFLVLQEGTALKVLEVE
jgi:serine/threonine protein kinase